MDKFTVLESVAAPLRIINVDTDMIIPKQYLKTIKRTGLGTGLFSEMRYRDDGSENPDFVLNQPAYRKAEILVAGDNFGCGSSREHAPWALLDFGIRCVISTCFADIFYNNCFKNGILPIVVSPEDLEKLFDDAERGANATLTVDLENQEIRGPDGGTVKFDIDPFRKHCLLNGLDDIGLTMEKAAAIDTFEKKLGRARLGLSALAPNDIARRLERRNPITPWIAGSIRALHDSEFLQVARMRLRCRRLGSHRARGVARTSAQADFRSCLSALRSQAAAQGRVGPGLRYGDHAGIEPDLKILELMNNQPEFKTPIWDYLAALVDERAGAGRQRRHAAMGPGARRGRGRASGSIAMRSPACGASNPISARISAIARWCSRSRRSPAMRPGVRTISPAS